MTIVCTNNLIKISISTYITTLPSTSIFQSIEGKDWTCINPHISINRIIETIVEWSPFSLIDILIIGTQRLNLSSGPLEQEKIMKS